MVLRVNGQKNISGFTLIELLVVIAIIGLISTISVISFNKIRSQARDARRLSDVKSLATALEFYYNDFGMFPQCRACSSQPNGVIDTPPYTEVNPVTGWQNCLGTKLAPYMSSIPIDPINKSGREYCYYSYFHPTQNMITISYYLENSNPNQSSAAFRGLNLYGMYSYSIILQPYGVTCSNGYCN